MWQTHAGAGVVRRACPPFPVPGDDVLSPVSWAKVLSCRRRVPQGGCLSVYLSLGDMFRASTLLCWREMSAISGFLLNQPFYFLVCYVPSAESGLVVRSMKINPMLRQTTVASWNPKRPSRCFLNRYHVGYWVSDQVAQNSSQNFRSEKRHADARRVPIKHSSW